MSEAYLRSLMAVSAIVGTFGATALRAETRVGADLDASVGYSTSPFAGVAAGGASNGSGTGTVSFRPFIASDNPNGGFRLDGEVSHTEYSRTYDGATNYSVNASVNQQASPRLGLGANVGYTNQVIDITSPIGSIIQPPLTPGSPTPPIILDPSAGLARGQRQSGLSGGVRLNYQMSAVDSLALSGSGSARRFTLNSPELRDHDYYGGGLTYERRINAATSIGLSVNASRTDFKGSTLGDARQITPSAVLRTRIGPNLSLNADAGVSFIDTDVVGGKQSSTALSGQASLCNEGVRSNLCLTLGRTVAPSAQIGLAKQLSVAVKYDYRLSQRSNFSLEAGYSRASNVIQQVVNTYDYGRVAGTFDRMITKRLSAVVSAGYSDSFRTIAANRSNFYGSVGLRYRFGDTR